MGRVNLFLDDKYYVKFQKLCAEQGTSSSAMVRLFITAMVKIGGAVPGSKDQQDAVNEISSMFTTMVNIKDKLRSA